MLRVCVITFMPPQQATTSYVFTMSIPMSVSMSRYNGGGIKWPRAVCSSLFNFIIILFCQCLRLVGFCVYVCLHTFVDFF